MTAPAFLNDPAYGPVDICKPIRDRRFLQLPVFLHGPIAESYAAICVAEDYRAANISLYHTVKVLEPQMGSFHQLPDFLSAPMSRAYGRKVKKEGYHAANEWLVKIHSEVSRWLKAGDFSFRHDDSALKDWAKAQAERVSGLLEKRGYTAAGAMAESLCEFYGFDSGLTAVLEKLQRQGASEIEINGAIVKNAIRLSTPKFWRGKMRTARNRGLDQACRLLGMVNQSRQIYVSNPVIRLRLAQKGANRAMLENLIATNQDGFSASLAELSDVSVSKPAIRRAELMTRMRGFEDISESLGHVAEFVTLTCPSKYHAANVGGGMNPKYKGYTPKDASDYLVDVLASIRKELKREDISVYGFRTAEPHHDGCPHWHLLLFMPSQHLKKVRQIFHKHARKVDGKEPGAAKRRCVFKAIDKSRGSATGYLAKYIAKGIDGEHVGVDLYGHDAKTSAVRITEWAGVWGIRQFQQIGGAPVTPYRELRRVSKEKLELWEAKTREAMPKIIAAARAASDLGDWAKYTMLNGGPILSRAMRPLQLWRMFVPIPDQTKQFSINPETGEILPFKGGLLAEALKTTKGVISRGVGLLTRFYTWTVETATEKNAFDFSDAQRSPWSSVNNCPAPQFSPAELEKIRQRVESEVLELDQQAALEQRFCPVPPPPPSWVERVRKAVDDRKLKNEALPEGDSIARSVAAMWAGWDTGELADLEPEPVLTSIEKSIQKNWGELGYA